MWAVLLASNQVTEYGRTCSGQVCGWPERGVCFEPNPTALWERTTDRIVPQGGSRRGTGLEVLDRCLVAAGLHQPRPLGVCPAWWPSAVPQNNSPCIYGAHCGCVEETTEIAPWRPYLLSPAATTSPPGLWRGCGLWGRFSSELRNAVIKRPGRLHHRPDCSPSACLPVPLSSLSVRSLSLPGLSLLGLSLSPVSLSLLINNCT